MYTGTSGWAPFRTTDRTGQQTANLPPKSGINDFTDFMKKLKAFKSGEVGYICIPFKEKHRCHTCIANNKI